MKRSLVLTAIAGVVMVGSMQGRTCPDGATPTCISDISMMIPAHTSSWRENGKTCYCVGGHSSQSAILPGPVVAPVVAPDEFINAVKKDANAALKNKDISKRELLPENFGTEFYTLSSISRRIYSDCYFFPTGEIFSTQGVNGFAACKTIKDPQGVDVFQAQSVCQAGVTPLSREKWESIGTYANPKAASNGRMGGQSATCTVYLYRRNVTKK
ncbi:MAG: hypothetical protein WD068_01390 [Candidatus Babeliales bacterium]